MKITQYALGTALMRQYRNFRVSRAGGRLMVSELRENWGETGFRGRDFDTALTHLSEEGYIQLETDSYIGEEVAILTEKGADRLSNVPLNPSDVLEESKSAAVLRAASKRREGGNGGWMSVLFGTPRQAPRAGDAERRHA